MKKTGRNEQCPCGSGKKYKHCHLKSGLPLPGNNRGTSKNPLNVFEAYNKTDKLLVFSALQLCPKNHGKNIRLERLMFNAIKGSEGNLPLTQQQLVRLLQSNYTFDYMEDPVESFFTENIIFIGGNYIVYPGIAENGTQILNAFLEGIFITENSLPTEFVHKVHNAAAFLLSMSNTIAVRCGHERYCFEEDNDEMIFVPEKPELDKLIRAVQFSQAEIETIASEFNIPLSSVDEFLCSSATLPENYDSNDTTIIDRPISKTDKGYIVILPTTIVLALTDYVKSLAVQYACIEELLRCYYQRQWRKIIHYTHEMRWEQTDIELPATAIDGFSAREGVFRIDNDKLAYVCLVETTIIQAGDTQEVPELNAAEHANERKQHSDRHNQRNTEVLAYLSELNKPVEFRYFTLFIIGGIGNLFFFSWNKPSPGNQILAFNFSDFQKIIFNEKLDKLSLWKFAKAYSRASETTMFSPLTGLLDAYVIYNTNEGSLLPTDDARPDMLYITLDTSGDFGRESIKKRDEHAALVSHKGSIAYLPVKKHSDYAPIYEERDPGKKNRLLIESYQCPIWVANSQAKNSSEKKTINDFVEAIAFWLFKLTPEVGDFLNQLGHLPIEIEIILDEKLYGTAAPTAWESINEGDIDMPFSIDNDRITIKVPFEIAHLLILHHNVAERLIMENTLNALEQLLVLRGFQEISEVKKQSAIDIAIPLGQAKMILFVDASKDPRLLNTDLLSTRYIQEAETAFILDNLANDLRLPSPLPAKLASPKEKVHLCGKIVAVLIGKVETKLKHFNAAELLEWLMIYNERYVHNREFREFLIPARIATFSAFPTEVETMLKKESKLVASSLAVRCLIEFVAARPAFGNKLINIDEVDELLALMNEVCQWGAISDTIHHGMSNPEIGLLPSGRIGISREFFNEFLKPFQEARVENEVQGYVDDFAEKMEIPVISKAAEYTSDVKELDDAFASEYNISLTKLMYIMRALIQMGIAKQESVISMNEESLINTIEYNEEELGEEEIRIGLKALTLESRESLSTPPSGFDKEDIFPWIYNRALSYIRRPLIKLKHPDGISQYYWGYRHVFSAGENLRTLIRSGRIKTKTGTLLDRYVAMINAEKGDHFRNEVCQYLKANTSLRVINYEVTISENGHLKAKKDYGDIDILAIDDTTKIIYSIECKNTVSARNPHEMKTELDKYLGREGQPGMIHKHVERDNWMHANKSKVLEFIGHPDDNYSIKSLLLTSQEIPLIYLAKERLPLHIVSFQSLRRKGQQVLDS